MIPPAIQARPDGTTFAPPRPCVQNIRTTVYALRKRKTPEGRNSFRAHKVFCSSDTAFPRGVWNYRAWAKLGVGPTAVKKAGSIRMDGEQSQLS